MRHKVLKINKLIQKKEISALGHGIQIQMIKSMQRKGCIQGSFFRKLGMGASIFKIFHSAQPVRRLSQMPKTQKVSFIIFIYLF